MQRPGDYTMPSTPRIISDLFNKHFIKTDHEYDKAMVVSLAARDIDEGYNSPTDAALSALLLAHNGGAHKLPYEMLAAWPEVKAFIEDVDKHFPE